MMIITKSAEPLRHTKAASRSRTPSPGRENPIHRLHETLGNRGVQRLYESGQLQAKLGIGPPGDRFEQEADRVADQVMRMPEPLMQAKPGGPLASSPCGEEELVQRQPLAEGINRVAAGAGNSSEVAPAMESAIRSLSGGGRPLSQPERSFFEPRFGTDFSRVRLHSGDSAGGLAETVQAQAFTVGHHIVLGAGQFEPGTPAGRRLLAHELTHVTQQTAANPTQGPAFPHVQRQPRPGKAGPREATVVIRWTEDQDKFYDRLLATLAGSPGFRGIDPKEFEYYSDTEPGLRAFSDSLHTSYGMHHSDRKVGDAVKVHFSADYDSHHDYHASDLTNKKISLVAETTVVKKPEKPVPPPPPPVAEQKSDDPIDEENFPGYAWHQVGSTFEGTKPSVAVVRAIVAENTDLDRDLLTATTATPFYRNYVKAGTIRPSYFSYRHPTKGIVARAFAEREGLPAEGESDPKLWLKESFSYKVYIFSPHPAKDTPHYAFRMPPSATPPPAPTEAEQEAYERWRKSLWPTHKILARGTMEWKLGATESFSQFGKDGWTKRDMQIKFTPNSTVGNKLITFLQTRLQLEQGGTPSNKPEIDIRADIYEFEPFYNMNWDPKQKRWVPESLKTPTPPGFKNQPSSLADPAAYLYDPPWAPPGQTKRFESVPVVPETAERLGALTWGLDSDRVECTNEPSASFDEAVKKFYTVPTVIGPDPARKEHYDVILDGFERNVTTLTTNQEKKLDPIAPLVNKSPNLNVTVGGSGDDSDIYPEGASEKRAQAVADYLKSKAVPEKNLTVIGYGATWALYPPTSKEGKEGLNRRVQISLSY